MADDSPDPDRIATQQDFGRELTAVRTRAKLTVRQVARAAGLPVSTAGDYFSGRHLPPDGRSEQLLEILKACGQTDPAELARWMSALQRAKRPPGRRPGGADARTTRRAVFTQRRRAGSGDARCAKPRPRGTGETTASTPVRARRYDASGVRRRGIAGGGQRRWRLHVPAWQCAAS